MFLLNTDLVNIFTDTLVFDAFLRWENAGRFDFNRGTLNRGFPDKLDDLIAAACGYDNAIDMCNHSDEGDLHTLKMLAGPHGWTIYCILKARNDKNTG